MTSGHQPPPEWLPTRLALFASSFAPHLGGVEELVRRLALQQSVAGTQSIVHTMRWPRDLPAREITSDGIEVRRHSYRVPEHSPRQIAVAAATNPFTLAAVIRQVRSDRSELIHVQCVSSGAWFAYQAARALRLPFVVTMQGELTMDADHVYEKSPLLRRTLRLLLERADAVTACSRATLDEAQEWAGIDLGERGTPVFNGVELAEFAEQRAIPKPVADIGRPYVLGIGRLVRQKGFDVLIAAFGDLVSDPSFAWDLVIAGDGPARGALVDQTAQLGITNRVHFVGRADRTLAVALFQHAAAFALPSRHEPFGIVNVEAMAAGTPVIATRVGGVPEFVEDGVSGLLVNPGDSADMAGALRRLHDEPALRTRLAARGPVVATSFDWSVIDHRYREVYATARDRWARDGSRTGSS